MRAASWEALLRAITTDPPTRPSAALRDGERARTPVEVTTPEQRAEARSTTPDRLRRALQGDLDTIVLRCLQKEPERRYGSASQLIEDLERHLAGRPISARPDTLMYRVSKFVGRHRVASAVAAAAAVLLTSLVIWDNTRLGRERDRARLEAAKANEAYLSVWSG